MSPDLGEHRPGNGQGNGRGALSGFTEPVARFILVGLLHRDMAICSPRDEQSRRAQLLAVLPDDGPGITAREIADRAGLRSWRAVELRLQQLSQAGLVVMTDWISVAQAEPGRTRYWRNSGNPKYHPGIPTAASTHA